MLATTRTALDPLVVRLARWPVVEESRSAQALPQAPQATKDIATAGAPQRDQFPYYLLFTRSNLIVARVRIFRRLHGAPFGSPNTFPRGSWLRVPAPQRVSCSTGSLDEQLVFLISLTAPERSVYACYKATKEMEMSLSESLYGCAANVHALDGRSSDDHRRPVGAANSPCHRKRSTARIMSPGA